MTLQICPMVQYGEWDTPRTGDDPQNREEAFCFEWHNQLMQLYRRAQIKDDEKRRVLFDVEVSLLEAKISAYRARKENL